MIATRIIGLLLEAKSFKNHIPKYEREKLEWKISRRPRLYIDDGISTVDDFIEFIEKRFKAENSSILLPYVPWIVLAIANAERKNAPYLILERIDEWMGFLQKYHVLKKNNELYTEHSDITKLSLFNFERAVVSYPDPIDPEMLLKTGQAKMVLRNSKLQIIKINTYQASQYFASGSRGRSRPWCISRSGDWDSYKQDGYNWYFIFDKKNGEKYAFDVSYGVAWNKEDVEVNGKELVKLYPMIKKLVKHFAKDEEDKIYSSVIENLEKIVSFSIRSDQVTVEAQTNGSLVIHVYVNRKVVSTKFQKEKRLTFQIVDSLFYKIAKETSSTVDVIYNDANDEVGAVICSWIGKLYG